MSMTLMQVILVELNVYYWELFVLIVSSYWLLVSSSYFPYTSSHTFGEATHR